MFDRVVPHLPAGRCKTLLLGLAISLAICAFLSAPPPAFATCGSAACFLVTGTQEGVDQKGSFNVDLSFQYVDQNRKLNGTQDVDEVLTPKVNFEEGILEPNHHSEVRTQNTLIRLDLTYSATNRLAAVLQLPLFNQRNHEHYDDVGTPDETFTNADGTTGFGDVQIGVRYLLLVKPKDLLLGGFRVSLPTGPYRLLDSEGAINEPTIQPGTGAYDYIGTLYYAHHPSTKNFEWFGAGAYRFNTENDLDYRIGNETIVNAGLAAGAGNYVTWSLQVNGRWTDRDQYKGEDVSSTGATFVNFTPGVRFASNPTLTLYAFLQIPIYQHVNESQLAPAIGFDLGISKTF